MQVLINIFQYILNMGAAVFLPIVFLIIGIIVKMKPSRAISAGLTLGVAFTGIGVVMSFMSTSIGTAAQAFVQHTGAKLTALDMGWAATLGLCWQWRYAFLMFPLHIIINIIMLALGMTVTLNVDMWNVANKVCTGYLVTAVSGSVIAGFVAAGIQTVLELKIADANRRQVYKITKIPGVTIPHPMFLNSILLWPLAKVLDKIIPTSKKIDAAALRQKIGIFGENHVIGFILGVVIGLLGGYEFSAALLLGIQAGTALTMFPMVAKLFMTALAPISDATSKFVQKRFPGKEINIGLDWPILAGCNEIYVACILSIPFIILFALVLPFNIVLPLANIMYLCVSVTAFVLFSGDLIKMLITNIVSIPFSLFAASYFAPIFDNLAKQLGSSTAGLPAGQILAWYGIDFGMIRWAACEISILNPIAIGFAVVYIILAYFYFKDMKKREASIEKELGVNKAPATTV